MRAQRGSVSVEFAALMPLLAIAMLLVAQVGLLAAQHLAVQHAAREGARAAAVDDDDRRARDAALRAGNLDAERAQISIEPSVRDVGTPVTVTVRYEPAVMPLITRFVPAGLIVRAAATMRSEHRGAG